MNLSLCLDACLLDPGNRNSTLSKFFLVKWLRFNKFYHCSSPLVCSYLLLFYAVCVSTFYRGRSHALIYGSTEEKDRSRFSSFKVIISTGTIKFNEGNPCRWTLCMVNKETWVIKLVKLRLSYKICIYFSRLGPTTVLLSCN